MGDPVTLLIWLVVMIVVGAVLLYAVDLLPDPPLTPPFRGLLKCLIVLVLLVVMIRKVGLF